MGKYKREDYTGFTLKFGQYLLEVVFRCGWPFAVAIDRDFGRKNMWRI